MRFRAVSLLLAAAALVACAVLATLWVMARTRSGHLVEELDGLRHAADSEGTRLATATMTSATSAIADTPTPLDSTLEARQALLADARAIPELARREAALLAVRRIRAQHAATPPPARALPPPLGTRSGPYFTDLFSDPGYLTLVREDWRSGRGESSARRLAALDLPEATKKQVEDVEFESFLGVAELAANATTLTTTEERQALMQVRKEMDEERQARLRQVLGEESFRKYSGTSSNRSTTALAAAGGSASVAVSRGPAGVATQEMVSASPLATRLSYSGSPLTEADTARLQTLIDTMATPTTPAYRLWYDVEFFKQAQSVLNPTQLDALRQIQEEQEARTLRSRLPKSSELPRTTRRARLEGGG